MKQEDKQRNYELARSLLSQQNFVAALIAGAAAMLLSAVFYGIAMALWRFAYGFAAALIGIAVGIAMQYLGRGIEVKFALVAAVYTIAGCILGNVCRVVMSMSLGRSVSPLDALQNQGLSALFGQAYSLVSLIDLFFWLIAVWFAVFLVKRPLSRAESLAIGTYELKR